MRRADVERALRFLERRRDGGGVVELMRAVSGVETDAAGLELGAVELDAPLARLLGTGDARFRPLRTPRGMALDLFPFQERGHGWLRLLGDLGVGAVLADDMGLGKTVQAIAMLVSEREERGGEGVRADARRLPDERRAAVGRARSSASPRACASISITGRERLAGTGPDPGRPAASTSSSARTTSSRATIDDLAAVAWDRLVLDEAQEVKNPATKRAQGAAPPRRSAAASR